MEGNNGYQISIGHSQLERLLKTNGIEVGSVSTGLDCLARLRDWQPDLLIVSPKLTWGSGVNVDTNQALAQAYNISSIPAFLIFKNGNIVARHEGVISEQILRMDLSQASNP